MSRSSWLALLLALVIALAAVPTAAEATYLDQEDTASGTISMVPQPTAETAVQAGSTWPSKQYDTTISSITAPLTLESKTYRLTSLSYTAPTGKSPITVPSRVNATLVIDGSVTLRGADAVGMQGATAAIHVEPGATLTIYSYHDQELSTSTEKPRDTLTVYGGSAADGSDGEDAVMNQVSAGSGGAYTCTWFNGAGGNGGGGAAAAIGGNGGNGGNGAASTQTVGKNGKAIEVHITLYGSDWDDSATDDNPGKTGVSGSSGTSGEGTGTIQILGRLTLNAYGGSGGSGGNGGSGCEGLRGTSNADHMIGGNGGGGGGGGGCAAPAIGAGGAGGSGGGSGGHLSSDKKGDITGCGGGGGGGGWPNGGGGGGGATVTSGGNDDINLGNNKGGSGGTGGKAGSTGSAGSDGGTIRSAKGRASKGGAGGSGVESDSASGGQGGVRVSKPSEYPGGYGGSGGGYLSKTEWNTAGSLLLSTANDLHLSSSLNYGSNRDFGDGQGHGSPKGITPSIIYDLMDCAVSVSDATYTGAKLTPSVTVTYSASSDRDKALVSFGNVHVSAYTTSYGENIHCPSGTATVTGRDDANRASVRRDGAVVGAKTQAFTIKKAKLTAIGAAITFDKDYTDASGALKFDSGDTYSYPATITLDGTYASTAAHDPEYDKSGAPKAEYVLKNMLRADGSTGEPDISWNAPECCAIRWDWARMAYTFRSSRGGTFTPQIVLTGMNDFEDYTYNVGTITVQKPAVPCEIAAFHPRRQAEVYLPDDVGTVLSYQWYLDNDPISGATGSTYTPTNDDAGHALYVKVTLGNDSPYLSDIATTGTVGYHSYSNSNGFCSTADCGEYEQPQKNSSGAYLLDNGGKMFWFAAYVNGDPTHAEAAADPHPSVSAKVTGNLSLQNPADTKAGRTTEWTPIGSAAKVADANVILYSGTFDGGGYTVSGLSLTETHHRSGLFATCGGTVKNFTLRGSIDVTGSNGTGWNNALGSVAGFLTSKGRISDVTSYVQISKRDGGTGNEAYSHVGGIVGGTDASGVTVERCLYRGVMSVAASTDCIGGVVGYANNNTSIDYCANLGTVTAAASGAYTGGILGYSNSSNTRIRHSYNYGTVTGVGNYCGAVIGLANSNASNNLMSDCYYLDTSAARGAGAGSKSTVVLPTAKTAAEFSSGEVCYLVNGKVSRAADGAVWMQNVDNAAASYGASPDSYPTFTAAAVYSHSDGRYSNDPERVNVTVSWGSMTFVCTAEWDPDTHTSTVTWEPVEENGNRITVTNDGNVDVNAAFAFGDITSAAQDCGLAGTFNVTSARVPRASGSTSGTQTAYLTLTSPKAPASLKKNTKLGTVTVTISAIHAG